MVQKYEMVRKFFEERARKWYIVLLIFTLIEIVNYGLLGMLIPMWACTIITIVVTIASICYIEIMYTYLREKIKSYLQAHEQNLYEKLNTMQQHMDDLKAELKEGLEEQQKLVSESTDQIKEDLKETRLITGSSFEEVVGHIGSLNILVQSKKDELHDEAGENLTRVIETLAQQSDNEMNYNVQNIEKLDNLVETINMIAQKQEHDAGEAKNSMLETIVNSKNEINEIIVENIETVQNELKEQRKLTCEVADAMKTDLKEGFKEQQDLVSESTDRISEDLKETQLITGSGFEEVVGHIGSLNVLVQSKTDELHDEGSENFTRVIEVLGQQSDNEMNYNVQNVEKMDNLVELINTIAQKQEHDAGEAKNSMLETIVNSKNEINEIIVENIETVQNELKEQRKLTCEVADAMKTELKEGFEEQQNLVSESTDRIREDLKETQLITGSGFEEVVGHIDSLNVLVQSKKDELHDEAGENLTRVIETLVQQSDNEMNYNVQNVEKMNNLVEMIQNATQTITNCTEDGKIVISDRLKNVEDVVIDKMNQDGISHTEQIAGVSTQLAENFDKLLKWEENTKNEERENSEKISGEIKNKLLELEQSLMTELSGKTEAVGQMIKEVIETKVTEIVNRTDNLSSQTSDVQKDITELLAELLENVDEDAEKARSAHQNIINQMTSFSRTTNEKLMSVLQDIDKCEELIEFQRKTLKTIGERDNEQAIDLKRQFEAFAGVTDYKQKEINSKLENLYGQIVNINSLLEVIKRTVESQPTTNMRKEQTVNKPTTTVNKRNPNRVEEISDVETGSKILNHYKDDKLIISEMYTGKHKKYDVQYNSMGKVIKSRNFDDQGDIVTELQYYDNGQVKIRTEKIVVAGRRQTVVSQFDQQGNKTN